MNLKQTFFFVSLWYVVGLIIVIVATKLLPLQLTYLGVSPKKYEANPLVYYRANFDGDHYLRIAQTGYGYAEEAFFPLYPNFIKFLSPFTKDPAIAGILISNIAFILSVVFLVHLLQIDFSEGVVKWTVIAILIFPTSFFFSAIYTESIFFLFVVLSFLFARRRNWWLAGLFGALAANTRFVGIFLIPALLVELWQQHKDSRIMNHISRIIPIMLVSTGLLIYMYYLWDTKGDPLAFFHVQKYYGQFRSEKIIMLYQVFWRYLKMILTVDWRNMIYMNIWLEVVVGVMFLITSIYSIFKTRLSYAVFSGLAYLVPTFTGSFVSLPRYVLVCISSFVIIGTWLYKYPRLRVIYGILSILLLIVFMSLYVRGYWVG